MDVLFVERKTIEELVDIGTDVFVSSSKVAHQDGAVCNSHSAVKRVVAEIVKRPACIGEVVVGHT